MRRKSAVDLANSIIAMLREEIAREKANGCPFTSEELGEAAAELEEEICERVAYCTTCKAAVAAAYNDRRIVEAAARAHARRRPAHQVIVGKEILGRSYGVCIEP